MKLIHHTTWLFFKAFLAVVIPACIVLFFVMRHLVKEEMDDSLQLTRAPVEQQMASLISTSSHTDLLGDRIFIEPVESIGAESFSDTLMEMPEEEDLEPFRMYTFFHEVDGTMYRVQVCRKQIETKDLAINIGTWALLTPVALLGLVLLWMRNRSKRFWSPFFHTLNGMRQFSLSGENSLQQVDTSVDEFRELMSTIHTMQESMVRDYQNVKQFTGNASHEIQTPIAVILNKIENISQQVTDQGLIEELESVRAAAHRLSRLNHSLLMLSRLDNQQYLEIVEIRVDSVLAERLAAIEPVMHEKDIQVTTQIAACTLQAHPTLIESLISNLLMNAVRHNIQHGSLSITLTASHLELRNSGPPLSRSTEELKQRFTKDNPASKSTGLGLAIVNEICNNYGWTFTYTVENHTHITRVSFSESALQKVSKISP